jgi:hypothetical protein
MQQLRDLVDTASVCYGVSPRPRIINGCNLRASERESLLNPHRRLRRPGCRADPKPTTTFYSCAHLPYRASANGAEPPIINFKSATRGPRRSDPNTTHTLSVRRT